MTRPSIARLYAVSAGLFCLLDAVWLGPLAGGFYRDQLGDLLAPRANVAAAAVFYAIFIAGLLFFVSVPVLADERPGAVRRAAGRGAFFGLVTYATWDLTNLAVLDGFPLVLAVVDMTWGTVLAASVAAGGVATARRFGWA